MAAYASLIGASPMEKSIVKNVKTKADENNLVFNKIIQNHVNYNLFRHWHDFLFDRSCLVKEI